MQTTQTEYKRPFYFPSNKEAQLIRNAITGKTYDNLRVGTLESKRLYRVVDATGRYNTGGYPISASSKIVNKQPNSLYFDDPEQFMRYFKCQIDYDFISKWRENQRTRFDDYSSSYVSPSERLSTRKSEGFPYEDPSGDSDYGDPCCDLD